MMKPLLALMLLASANAFAQPAALSRVAKQADARLRTIPYSAEAVVDVPVKRGQITHIVLGDDEMVMGSPVTGKGANCGDDTHSWCVAVQGRDLFVKPKTGASATNMIVLTNARRHAFALHPVEGGATSLMRLTITSPPPPPPPRPAVVSTAPPPPTARELIAGRWAVKPVVRNSEYSVATGKNSDDIVPVLVFDDGTHTYFSFPNNRPLPTIFETTSDGSEEMVNATMNSDDLLVADRVGRRFVLRLGSSVAAIINEAYDIDGVRPVDGTTVPGVARVFKLPAQGRTP